VAADTRLSESHIRIDRNPIEQRIEDCRHLYEPAIIVYRLWADRCHLIRIPIQATA
jgi:hypothetical protein